MAALDIVPREEAFVNLAQKYRLNKTVERSDWRQRPASHEGPCARI